VGGLIGLVGHVANLRMEFVALDSVIEAVNATIRPQLTEKTVADRVINEKNVFCPVHH